MCPSPCGRWLSHLSLGPLGLELAVSNVTTGEIHIVERGQPLFWSWSPDATQLAVHVENRVLISDSAGRSTRVLTDDAGPFVTPWWLPGGSVVYAVGDRIVAAGPDDAVTTLVARGSSGRFSLDPEGQRLAYIASTGSDGTLVVLDLLSLAPTEVTSAPVVAFFWSPDGRRLAALTATGDGLVQWLIVDGSDTLRLPPFRPTRSWAGSVLSFFEQYAQSHNVWSSDATALVASAIDDEGHSGALVHTIDSPDNTQWIPDAERPTRSWAGTVLSFFEQYAQSHNVWSSDATALVVPAVGEEGRSGALVQTIDSPTRCQWIPDAELAWWA